MSEAKAIKPIKASQVIIDTTPFNRAKRPAVMRCAKQRDYSPIHILPYTNLSVYIFLEIKYLFCKYAPE